MHRANRGRSSDAKAAVNGILPSSDANSSVANIDINGNQVLTNFDVYASAGAKNKAIVRSFTQNANASGAYVVQFTSVINNSLVSGIEVQ